MIWFLKTCIICPFQITSASELADEVFDFSIFDQYLAFLILKAVELWRSFSVVWLQNKNEKYTHNFNQRWKTMMKNKRKRQDDSKRILNPYDIYTYKLSLLVWQVPNYTSLYNLWDMSIDSKSGFILFDILWNVELLHYESNSF